MAAFFTSWPMWEKLVFILACAIVVTVLLGFAKLGHTHWKLRKYSALAEKEKQETAVQRQLSMRAQRRKQAEDVPFGIRAIESGIEVEGVWISRSNTPDPASREGSVASMWDHISRKAQQPDLERQSCLQEHGRVASDSTFATVKEPSSMFDRATLSEILPSSRTSRDPSPESAITKPSRSRHPPPTLAKYSTTPYLPRSNSAATVLQVIDAIHHASGPMLIRQNSFEVGDDSAISSGESSSGSDLIASSAPGLLSGNARPKRSSFDLELMQTHRMSQAAETGQLTPRGRKSGSSGEWARPTDTSVPSHLIQTTPRSSSGQMSRSSSSHQVYQREAESSSAGLPINALSLPQVQEGSAARGSSTVPGVTPFAKFCQNTSASSNHEAQKTASSDKNRISGEALALSEPAVPASDTPMSIPHIMDPLLPERDRGSFEKRKSDILRGHGSGFEILLPGTLKPPEPSETSIERQRGLPPCSLNNYGSKLRSSSAESHRKLQKKRGPGVDSRSSIDSRRQSRASIL